MYPTDPGDWLHFHSRTAFLHGLEIFHSKDVVGLVKHLSYCVSVLGLDRKGAGYRVADAAVEFLADALIHSRVLDRLGSLHKEVAVGALGAEADGVHASQVIEDRDAAIGELLCGGRCPWHRELHDKVDAALQCRSRAAPLVHDGDAAALDKVAAHDRHDAVRAIGPALLHHRLVAVVEWVVLRNDSCNFHIRFPPKG